MSVKIERVILRFKDGDALVPIRTFVDSETGKPLDIVYFKNPFNEKDQKRRTLVRTRFSNLCKKAIVYLEE